MEDFPDDDIPDDDDFSDDDYPDVVKLKGIRGSYIVSESIDVSAQLLELIHSSTDLKLELCASQCCPDDLNTWSAKDEAFGLEVFEDCILSSTLRKLKGTDARDLYDVEIEVEEDEEVNSVDVTTNAYGKAILRLVSQKFDDRIILIIRKFLFLKVVFSFVKGDDELLARHKEEIMEHIMRLQDEMELFSKQFPVVPPTVGNFGYQLSKLDEYKGRLESFMANEVAPALLLLQQP